MPWTPPKDSALSRLLALTWQPDPQVEKTLADVPFEYRVCDLGAGGRRVRPDAVCVDLAPGPNVDVVSDIHHLPLADGSFGLVLCTGTLGLCEDPPRVLAECFRILRPGGLIHLEVPMFQPYLPEPEDYWRWTLPGLRKLSHRAGFDEVRSGPLIGPVSALANSATYLASHLFAKKTLAHKLVRGSAHLVFGSMKYLDRMIPTDRRRDVPFAYGLFYVGKKPEAAI